MKITKRFPYADEEKDPVEASDEKKTASRAVTPEPDFCLEWAGLECPKTWICGSCPIVLNALRRAVEGEGFEPHVPRSTREPRQMFYLNPDILTGSVHDSIEYVCSGASTQRGKVLSKVLQRVTKFS